MLRLVRDDPAPVIGIGGGRGAAKSAGADRVAALLLAERPGTIACMMMRNYDQVYKYHMQAIATDFPFLEKSMKKTMPANVYIGKSRLDFSYAENIDDIERRFRSANYKYIFIDQAEQFSERELREVRKANRVKGGERAKLVLLFNMRGAGIAGLRKWFYLHEVNKDEDAGDYVFLKMNPWDNIEWVRASLKEDGYNEEDYYRWTDEQRKSYAAKRGPYTHSLASDDAVIRKADWEGDWDSLEGTYFSNSFDLESVRVGPGTIAKLWKPWGSYWLGADWGKTHNTAVYWATRINLSPSEAKAALGWDVPEGIKVTTIYREMIVNEMDAAQVGHSIIDCTPPDERSKYRSFFLSPEECTDDPNCVGYQMGAVLHADGMPGPVKADNERIGGWMLIDKMMRATKGKGWGIDKEGKRFQYTDALLISAECQELLAAIPILMRDPKNLDDVLKTDKGQAKIEQDVADACFVAGTPVLTKRGYAPIERVDDSDEVMTREGWHRVTHSWMTREYAPVVRAIFSNGRTVICTPNHRFLTDRGFVSLDSIRYSDKITIWTESSLTEESTKSGKTDITPMGLSSYTGQYGDTTREKYLAEISSITSTILPRAQRTFLSSRVSRRKSTCRFMNLIGQTRLSILRRFALWLLNGTGQKKEESGTLSTRGASYSQGRKERAHSAERLFWGQPKESSALTTANHLGGGQERSTTSKGRVRYAAKSSDASNTARHCIAAESAVRLVGLQEAGYADVYDIEVDGKHEFYANGFLVHNCRYTLKSMLAPKHKTSEDKYNINMQAATPEERLVLAFKHQFSKQKVARRIMPPSWKNNIG